MGRWPGRRSACRRGCSRPSGSWPGTSTGSSVWAWSCRRLPWTYWAGMPEARIRATPRLATSSALPAFDQSVPRCAAEGAGVRVVADLGVQEVEDVLRVVIERGGLFLDEGVGGVGVGGRGEQVGVDRAGAERRRGRAGADRAGVERGKSLRRCRAASGIGLGTETVTVTLARS